MLTIPGEFEMTVPPSGLLVRMMGKLSFPSAMKSLMISMLLHLMVPSSPGSNVILKSLEQKSSGDSLPVPEAVILESINHHYIVSKSSFSLHAS